MNVDCLIKKYYCEIERFKKNKKKETNKVNGKHLIKKTYREAIKVLRFGWPFLLLLFVSFLLLYFVNIFGLKPLFVAGIGLIAIAFIFNEKQYRYEIIDEYIDETNISENKRIAESKKIIEDFLNVKLNLEIIDKLIELVNDSKHDKSELEPIKKAFITSYGIAIPIFTLIAGGGLGLKEFETIEEYLNAISVLLIILFLFVIISVIIIYLFYNIYTNSYYYKYMHAHDELIYDLKQLRLNYLIEYTSNLKESDKKNEIVEKNDKEKIFIGEIYNKNNKLKFRTKGVIK